MIWFVSPLNTTNVVNEDNRKFAVDTGTWKGSINGGGTWYGEGELRRPCVTFYRIPIVKQLKETVLYFQWRARQWRYQFACRPHQMCRFHLGGGGGGIGDEWVGSSVIFKVQCLLFAALLNRLVLILFIYLSLVISIFYCLQCLSGSYVSIRCDGVIWTWQITYLRCIALLISL